MCQVTKENLILNLNTMNAVVVDDDPSSLLVLSNQLKEMGITPICCQTVEAAIYRIFKFRPAFITLDLHLEESDGIELLQIRRRVPEIHNIPIIVTSGESRSPIIAESILAGASAYLIKPIMTALLIEAIKKIGVKIPSKDIQ